MKLTAVAFLAALAALAALLWPTRRPETKPPIADTRVESVGSQKVAEEKPELASVTSPSDTLAAPDLPIAEDAPEERTFTGDPDFGHHVSYEAMLADFENSLAKAVDLGDSGDGSSTGWRARWLSWGNALNRSSEPPVSSLMQTEMTGAQRERLSSLLATHNDSIAALADSASFVLRDSLREYVYGDLQRVPAGDPIERTTPPNREKGNYLAIFTMVDEGKWTYALDFQSQRFPALQEVLDDIRTLRIARGQAVESLVTQFDRENGALADR